MYFLELPTPPGWEKLQVLGEAWEESRPTITCNHELLIQNKDPDISICHLAHWNHFRFQIITALLTVGKARWTKRNVTAGGAQY